MQQDKITLLKGNIWKQRMAGARARRKQFMDTGHEVWRYGYSKDYQFPEYQTLPNAKFKAKVAKTSEAIQIYVPLIMPPNPRRLVHPQPWETVEVAERCKAHENWLNYTKDKTGLIGECRSIGTDGIVFGRGVGWTGLHPRKGLTCTRWMSVRDLLLDGNANSYDEIQWGGRRRLIPRYELIDLVDQDGGDVDLVRALKPYGKRSGDKSGDEDEMRDRSTDVIEVFEVYSRIGLHNDSGGLELVTEQARREGLPADTKSVQSAMLQMDEQPLRYLVTREGQFICETPWEIPFYEMDEWPWTPLDFYPNPGSVWPVSPMAAGLGYQRCINYITTVLMGRATFDFRTLYAILDQNRSGLSNADKFKVMEGPDIDVVKIDAQGDSRNINEFIQQFNSDKGHIAAGINLIEFFGSKFDKAVGLYNILYDGEGKTQSRTAQDAAIKDRNSRNRVEDMRDQVAIFHGMIAKKEDFAASFLYNQDQIARVLGPEQAQKWGRLVSDPALKEPMAMAESLVMRGVRADQAIAQAQSAGYNYTLEDLALQADYTIEVSSSRRHDLDQQVDAVKEIGQTLWPVQLGSMDPMEKAAGYRSLATLPRLLGLEAEAKRNEELADYFQQQAMAMLMQPQPQPVSAPAQETPPTDEQPLQPIP